MSGKTHAIIGANAVWVASLFGQVDQNIALLIAAGALSALLPDIDARQATIHYLGHGVLGMFKRVFRHRGFFHSILATMIIFLLSVVFLQEIHPLLPIVITIGYASHPLIDAFNAEVQYFFPYPRFMSFIPRPLRFKVNSPGDHLFFIAGTLGILLFFFLHLTEIQSALSIIPTSGF